MIHLIDKDALVAEIESKIEKYTKRGEESDTKRDGYGMYWGGVLSCLNEVRALCDALEVREVDLNEEIESYFKGFGKFASVGIDDCIDIAKHFFELGIKAQHDNWKVVNNINLPQADKNKIYCVLSKNKYLLARVIDHPQDDDLLQWKCTEFPFHRYDMCEGDKYMQIV